MERATAGSQPVVFFVLSRTAIYTWRISIYGVANHSYNFIISIDMLYLNILGYVRPRRAIVRGLHRQKAPNPLFELAPSSESGVSDHPRAVETARVRSFAF